MSQKSEKYACFIINIPPQHHPSDKRKQKKRTDLGIIKKLICFEENIRKDNILENNKTFIKA